MKKSEKILLGVLAVVLLWALYILVLEDKPTPQVQTATTEGYQTVIDSLHVALDQAQLSELEAYRITLARQELGNGLFYASTSQFYFAGGDGLGASDEDGLAYSGYLQAGKKVYAIINGIEYAVGDEIAVGGYRLSQITHGYVVLERRDATTGRAFKRQLPLAEDDVEDVTLKAVY